MVHLKAGGKYFTLFPDNHRGKVSLFLRFGEEFANIEQCRQVPVPFLQECITSLGKQFSPKGKYYRLGEAYQRLREEYLRLSEELGPQGRI